MPKASKNDGREVPAVIEDHSRAPKVVRYERKKKLGQGGFATVYEVQEVPNNRIWACKVVHKRKLRQEHFKKLKNEVRLHRQLNHKNIVGFETYFEDSERVYILLEHCANQSLMELLRRRTRLNETESLYFMSQILEAVEYLHTHNIIHRDLKLGNLLVDAHMQIKICDFGLAAQLATSDERKTTICGTPNYIAPEILEGNRRGGHSFAVDIWSLGVILFTFLVGKPPFETKHVQQTYKRIRQLKYSFPPELRVSSHAKQLISSILIINADRRPTLEQIKADPFFTSNSIPSRLPQWILYTPYNPDLTEEDVRLEYQKYRERRVQEDRRHHRHGRVSPTNQQPTHSKPPTHVHHRRRTDGGAPAIATTRPSSSSPPPHLTGTEHVRPRSQSSPARPTMNGFTTPVTSTQTFGRREDTRNDVMPPPMFRENLQRGNPAQPLQVYRPPEERIAMQRQTHSPPTNPHGIMFDLGDRKQPDPLLAVPERKRHEDLNGIVCHFGHEKVRDSSQDTRQNLNNHHTSMTLESRRMMRNLNPSCGPKLPMKNRPKTRTDPSDHMRMREITNKQQTQHASMSLEHKQMVQEERYRNGRARDVCGYEAGDDENCPPHRRTDSRGSSRSDELKNQVYSDHLKKHPVSLPTSSCVPTSRLSGLMEPRRKDGSSRAPQNHGKTHSHRHQSESHFYDQLRSIHDEIEKSFCNAPPPEDDVLTSEMERLSLAKKPKQEERLEIGNDFEKGDVVAQQSEIYVRQWVDYSKKYGIGYLLSNGHTGVYFNDTTKIILHADQQTVSYIDSHKDVEVYSISVYPGELTKKIQLLRHFQEYLTSKHPADICPHSDSNELVFIKKWLKTRHSILFRLSNKTIQINFNDETEIILNSMTRLVTYTDKQRFRRTYPLQEILQTRQKDLRKRMKYTQDVLRQLVCAKK